MKLLAYFRSKRRLTADLAAARAENERLREQLITAQLVSWIRRPQKPLPLPRATPHLVHPGRHRFDAPTEAHPRKS